MPGRVSVRSARKAAAGGQNTELQTPKQTSRSKASSSRSSANAIDIPDEGPASILRDHICGIFGDAQKGTVTQRKLAVLLRKIQEECCYEPDPKQQKKSAKKGEGFVSSLGGEGFDEAAFNEEISRCVIRVLPVKKSEPVGDRIVRFLGVFLKFASDKDNAIAAGTDPEVTETFPETPSSRLTSQILSTILPLLTAKDKVVRFRATQISAYIVNTLDSIDDELFTLIRHGLLKRLRDKEANVRVQAVLGLGRLADDGDEEEEDSDDEEQRGGILSKLLDVLQNDPSAEVRRSLLLNLPFAPSTLPFLLERARDCDPPTRRALYARLLPALGDFRHLSLTHREKLLRWGLRDRDDNVRKATARLFRERWIEDCAASAQVGENGEEPAALPPGQLAPPSLDALLELLERVDVVNSGSESGIALEAMREFWEGRPDYVDIMSFDQDYWDNLTPESVFIARTFNDYCRRGAASDGRLLGVAEDRMPEVTRLGFIIQKNMAFLIEDVQRVASLSATAEDAEGEAAEAEEDTVAQEFCVEQLLQIALTQDYSDEIGRRKMFSVMREALALAELPEECTRLVIDVLRSTCGRTPAGEKEFCEIVLEAVAEVHDTIMGSDEDEEKNNDESFHSATSHLSDDDPRTPTTGQHKSKNNEDGQDEEVDEEKAIREIMVNMKCLHIAQCMLQNVECSLESNSHLVTMLNNLVIPAVRSQEAPIRERGLVCLGLCCLLSKNLSEENLTLFLHCYNKGHDALQIIALQIITDILTSHPSLLRSTAPQDAEVTVTAERAQSPSKSPSKTKAADPLLKPIQKMYSKSLKSPTNTVQTHGAVSLSKLLLSCPSSLDCAPELLKQMLLAYYDPDTRANAGLRQALSYFLPVFCHTKPENALMMARTAIPVVHLLHERMDELDGEDDELGGGMVGMAAVGAMIVDWTDSRKAVEGTRTDDAPDAHVALGEEILERALTPGCNKEERKTLISMLSKLHIMSSSAARAADAIRRLLELASEAQESKLSSEASTRNALNKLITALTKQIGTVTDASGSSNERETADADSDATVMASKEPLVKQEPASENEEGCDEGDMTDITMMTDFVPDAEGTRIMNLEDDDDDDIDELSRDLSLLRTGKEDVRSDESLLDSLLESEVDV